MHEQPAKSSSIGLSCFVLKSLPHWHIHKDAPQGQARDRAATAATADGARRSDIRVCRVLHVRPYVMGDHLVPYLIDAHQAVLQRMLSSRDCLQVVGACIVAPLLLFGVAAAFMSKKD